MLLINLFTVSIIFFNFSFLVCYSFRLKFKHDVLFIIKNWLVFRFYIQFNQVIIFVNNIIRCETLKDILEKNEFPTIAIHAELPQEERIKKFDSFKEFKTRIMVATELYGRGVDFLKVNTVINYDMSTDPDAYVHRVGRAGRFGTKGITITFLASDEDQKVFDECLKKYPNIKAEVLPQVIDKAIYCK